MRTRIARVPRRRLKAEINVVPYIDVMLVLLVIFMVVSPLSPIGSINLPRAEHANTPPAQYLELSVKKTQAQTRYQLALRKEQKRDELGAYQSTNDVLTQLDKQRKSTPQIAVLIAAEPDLRYEEVVQLISTLKKNGIAKIGLATK